MERVRIYLKTNLNSHFFISLNFKFIRFKVFDCDFYQEFFTYVEYYSQFVSVSNVAKYIIFDIYCVFAFLCVVFERKYEVVN